MRRIVLAYPHHLPSREPKRLRAAEIWRVGEAARAQVCPHPRRPRVDVSQVIARTGRLQVNGLAFETHWEYGEPIADEAGRPVLGATEHDERVPGATMIYVNGEAIGEREDLARSTALHELGHAVFDAPAWIERSRTKARTGDASVRRLQLADSHPPEDGALPNGGGGIDWREWRANEFMGAFLAPPALLHKHLVRQAAALGLPMFTPERSPDLPVVSSRRAGFERLETLAIELADTFGVSVTFMEVRLRKYGFVRRG